jgi:hypothetical protein
LSPDEAFKVIVNDGFGQGGKVSPASRMEKDGVSSQAFGDPGDGGLGTVSRPCDLTMSGAGGEARSDGDEKRRPLEVVSGGERLS